MTAPTARELLDDSREESLELLADRVEKVLALHVEWWSWPGGKSRCATCENTVRILNGEEP